jgi:hypothetical protein
MIVLPVSVLTKICISVATECREARRLLKLSQSQETTEVDIKGVQQAREQKTRRDSLEALAKGNEELFFVPQGGNADGPLVRRYKQLTSGGAIGMAFGYFGKASANMHRLLGEVAATFWLPKSNGSTASLTPPLPSVWPRTYSDASGEQRSGSATGPRAHHPLQVRGPRLEGGS